VEFRSAGQEHGASQEYGAGQEAGRAGGAVMTVIAPYPLAGQPRPGRVHARRCARSGPSSARSAAWVIGTLVAVLVMAGIGLLASGGGQSACQSAGGQPPAGRGPLNRRQPARSPLSSAPGASRYPTASTSFRQPLAGDGSITVRVTSLAGLLPPANAGKRIWPVRLRARRSAVGQGRPHHQGEPRPGPPRYAAITVAAGHGVRIAVELHRRHTAGPARHRRAREPRAGCG